MGYPGVGVGCAGREIVHGGRSVFHAKPTWTPVAPESPAAAVVQALMRELQESRARIEALLQGLEKSDETIRLLKRRLYAAKRERFTQDPPGQQSLFGQTGSGDESSQAAEACGEDDSQDGESTSQRERRRRSHRRLKVAMDELRHETIEHRLKGEARNCPCCGCQRKEFGLRVSRQIEIEPARIHVREDKTLSRIHI